MGRSTSTSVKVHGGAIESLTQATSAGIGVRVIEGRRQGFAWAGSLDDDVVAEVLAEARDNVAYAQPEPWVGLAEPDGVEPPPIDLWREGLAAQPTERKVDLALELERAVRARDPRISGVRTAQWADGAGEGAVATSTGIAVAGRSTFCHLSVQALATRRRRDQDRLRRVGRPRARRRGSRRGGGGRRRPCHPAAGRRPTG